MSRIIAALLLILALLPNPYGFYVLVRVVVFGVCGYEAYRRARANLTARAWLFGTIAFVYNPILPLYLTREIWMPVDLFTAILLVWSTLRSAKTNPNLEPDADQALS